MRVAAGTAIIIIDVVDSAVEIRDKHEGDHDGHEAQKRNADDQIPGQVRCFFAAVTIDLESSLSLTAFLLVDRPNTQSAVFLCDARDAGALDDAHCELGWEDSRVLAYSALVLRQREI